MLNLRKETLDAMGEAGKDVGDILFISTRDCFALTWEQFDKLADYEYDDGYGSPEIDEMLKIVFTDNTWLSRGEYDGSEWWDYNKCPKLPSNNAEIPSNILMSSN